MTINTWQLYTKGIPYPYVVADVMTFAFMVFGGCVVPLCPRVLLTVFMTIDNIHIYSIGLPAT